MSHAEKQWYARLHHGSPPARVEAVSAQQAHRREFELGVWESVIYRMNVSRPPYVIRYRHDFAPSARPILYADEHGALHPRGGSYRVTTRGIVDLPKGVHTMSQIVRYSGAQMPPRPNPYEEGPTYRNQLALYGGGRRELSQYEGNEGGMRFAKALGAAGTAALIGGYAASRTNLSLGWRGIAQGFVGVLTGWIMRKRYPNAGIGIACYGAVAAPQGVAAEIRLRQYLAGAGQTQQPTQTTNTGALGAGTTTAPASGFGSQVYYRG